MDPLGSAAGYDVKRYIAHCPEYTIAVLTSGEWEGVGATWNKRPNDPAFPQQFGNQLWFILPEPIAGLVLVHEQAITRAIGKP
jgi:hypothetical protein